MEVMYSNSADNQFFINNSFIGFKGEISDLSVIINDLKNINLKPNKKVRNILNDIDDLKKLGLSEDILKLKISELSYGEYKLILLLKIVESKPKIIILNNFDLGFNSKMKSKISKYIKTINALEKTSFVIISNDLIFLNKNIKHLIIAQNKIIKYQGDIITAIKQNLLEKPEIIKFIEEANKHNAKLDYTLDSKELLKGIYRSVF